ncbi:MAG: hypothetical protein K6G56_07030 [Clostridiales bacterium]|nr:hypothetical protein [Clostridiales bacterium]
MDNEKMTDVMADIDPAFIEEARPGRMKRVLRTVGSVAAALVFCAGLSFVVPKLLKSGADDHTAYGALPTESVKNDPAQGENTSGGIGGEGSVRPSEPVLQNAHIAGATEDPQAPGKLDGDAVGYLLPAGMDFCLTQMTIDEAASRFNYIVTAVCRGSADEANIYPFTVADSFGKSLEGDIEVCIPDYSNTSLADGFRPSEGSEYLLFLSRRANVMNGREYFLAEQTVGRENGRNHIFDIADMTYDELIAAMPGVIAENPCTEPDEIIGDFIRSDDPEVIFEGSDAVLLAKVVSMTRPMFAPLTYDGDWILLEIERTVKGDEAKIEALILRAKEFPSAVPCALVPAGSVKEGETMVFCFTLIEGTGPLIVSAPNAIFSPDSSEGRLLLNK